MPPHTKRQRTNLQHGLADRLSNSEPQDVHAMLKLSESNARRAKDLMADAQRIMHSLAELTESNTELARMLSKAAADKDNGADSDHPQTFQDISDDNMSLIFSFCFRKYIHEQYVKYERGVGYLWLYFKINETESTLLH